MTLHSGIYGNFFASTVLFLAGDDESCHALYNYNIKIEKYWTELHISRYFQRLSETS